MLPLLLILATLSNCFNSYKRGVFNDLGWSDAEKETAASRFSQQFRAYSNALDATKQASHAAENRSPSPKRRKLDFFDFDFGSDDDDDDDVGLGFITGGPGVAAVDEIESYCREERIPTRVNPLDYWRSNSYRFPVLARMVRNPFDPIYHAALH
jgi:hypothetical protein